MNPTVEDPLPGESEALETEMVIPTASPEVTTLTVAPEEPEVPIVDLPVVPTQPSFLLAIAQGNYQLRRFFSLLCDGLSNLTIS